MSLIQKALVLTNWGPTKYQLTTKAVATIQQAPKKTMDNESEEGGSKHPSQIWTPEQRGVLAGSPP